MRSQITQSETFFARVMVTSNNQVYGFDKYGSVLEDGILCLKFVSNITSATKYESVEDSRKEKFLKFNPDLQGISILTESEDGQIRLNKITEKGPMEEFFKNLHVIEIEAFIKVKNLLRG